MIRRTLFILLAIVLMLFWWAPLIPAVADLLAWFVFDRTWFGTNEWQHPKPLLAFVWVFAWAFCVGPAVASIFDEL